MFVWESQEGGGGLGWDHSSVQLLPVINLSSFLLLHAARAPDTFHMGQRPRCRWCAVCGQTAAAVARAGGWSSRGHRIDYATLSTWLVWSNTQSKLPSVTYQALAYINIKSHHPLLLLSLLLSSQNCFFFLIDFSSRLAAHQTSFWTPLFLKSKVKSHT